MKKATELEWLRYFYTKADFGPAHGDVMICLQDESREKTKMEIPDGYCYE